MTKTSLHPRPDPATLRPAEDEGQTARPRSTLKPGGVIVVGATSVIGQATAHEYARAGHPITLIGRDAEELSAIASDITLRHTVETRVHRLDICALDQHHEIVDACFSEVDGEIDGVIVCVGYQPNDERARTDGEELDRVIKTNFSGVAAFLERCATQLAKRGSGFICALSSVAGDRGRQSNYVYGSAKAGLSTYLQGLRNRMFPHGVTVTTVKAGYIDTRLTYGQPGIFLAAAPESIARSIRRVTARGAGVVYLPWFWRVIMTIIRAIPESLFKRLRL